MSISLYYDSETIPDQRTGAFERYLDQVAPPGQYKKKESIDAWMLENAEAIAEQDYQKTGLNGLHGEICSIAFALDDGDIHSVTRGENGIASEPDLLRAFWELMQVQAKDLTPGGHMPRLQWIGHNVIDFDLRFLKQRSIVNGIKPAFLVPADARHGGDWVFDTMKEWCGTYGSNRYVKQDDLVDVLGIYTPIWGAPAMNTDGSQVWNLYKSGQFELISIYNKLDVHKVREIHRRMTWQP